MTRKAVKVLPVVEEKTPSKTATNIMLSSEVRQALRLHLASGATGADRSVSAYIERLIKADLSL